MLSNFQTGVEIIKKLKPDIYVKVEIIKIINKIKQKVFIKKLTN